MSTTSVYPSLEVYISSRGVEGSRCPVCTYARVPVCVCLHMYARECFCVRVCCVSIRVHVFVWLHTCVSLCVRIRVCVHTRVDVFVFVSVCVVCVCTGVCVCVPVCVSVHVRPCVSVWNCVSVRTRVYVSTCLCTSAHVCIRTCVCLCPCPQGLDSQEGPTTRRRFVRLLKGATDLVSRFYGTEESSTHSQ